MPYSGPNDDKLPSNVKAMPAAKRRQWVSVWNDRFRACMKGKDASRKSCESAAFQAANGVVKS